MLFDIPSLLDNHNCGRYTFMDFTRHKNMQLNKIIEGKTGAKNYSFSKIV